MADLRIVDAPVLLQESITDNVKMPTGGLGNFSIRLGDIVWYVVTKEQLANKNYVDLSSKGVKDSLDVHIADKNNPHKVTKEQVGLGNVDNTADVDKPVSNATKSAITTATTDMATKAYVNQKDNLKADIVYVDGKDGDLSTLTTTDKSNLVKAINEINSKTEGVVALYDKNVTAGAGANGWTSDLVEEDGLTQRQINALNKIYHPRQYGTLTYGTGDDTKALQDCADALPNGATFRFDGIAKLSRAVGYHTDIYGTEGRAYGRLTVNGGQACLIFREKKDIVIDLRGAELFTETYGQGIIDLYKCENVTIIGGKLSGGGYIRETGEYKWIPLDGNTGAGEKGTNVKGFNTTVLNPDIGTSRNNQFITQNETSGGYGGQFPQFDGTKASQWGVWRGGQIGNQGYAFCIIGGRNIEISHTETHGFNGGSFIIGLQRTLDGSRNFARISTPESRSYTPELVNIHDNYLHDNYAGGCQLDRGLHVRFRDNLVFRMGHPNASAGDLGVDPGYGFATGRAMPCFDYDVSDNYFMHCYRKGIDTHQGTGFRFTGNKIWGTKFHGIGIAVDDDFVDTYYQPYFDHFAIVQNNEILAGNVGIFYANGQFGRARREDAKKRWEQLHVVIDGNLIRANQCFYYNYGHSPFKIINNTFVYAAPFANEKPPTGTPTAIYIGSLNRGLVTGNILSNNTFRNSKDGNFGYFINVEGGYNQTRGLTVTGNLFDVTPWYYVANADSQYAHNDVVTRSGIASTVFLYAQGKLVPDAVIENNIVSNDFLHQIVFGGSGTGAIAYPRIDVNGRISGVQLLSGGTGYTGTVAAYISNRGRSKGATFTATAVNGVIDNVTVVTSGRFYRSTYLYSVPVGLSYYDMRFANGNVAPDIGNGESTSSNLIFSTSNMSALVNPFGHDGIIKYANTIASATLTPAQFFIYNGGIKGGTIAFWFKVASNQVTTETKRVDLFTMQGSYDGANNPVGSGQIDLFSDGFTIYSPVSRINNADYTTGTKLEYDVWHHFVISNVSYESSSIVFGTSTVDYSTSVTASFAHMVIHRGYTYNTAEISDLYDETKAIFGK